MHDAGAAHGAWLDTDCCQEVRSVVTWVIVLEW